MGKKLRTTVKPRRPKTYRSPDVPLSAIRRYARRIAERFGPDKIILFGSYAYGTPNKDSDVDIMVIMPAANEINQSVRIWRALDAPFPVDLFVRTPEKLRRRLHEGDWFLREVIEKGKVLYEEGDGAVGTQSRRRPSSRPSIARR
jgi:predicted nucleotidyltransferase